MRFKHNGDEFTGRVIKGGMKPTVALNLITDADMPAIDTTPTELLPPAEDALTDWAVSSYKEVPGHNDSVPYTGVITFKGIPVIAASNDGWGGPDSFGNIDQKRNWVQVLNETLRGLAVEAAADPLMICESWVLWDWLVRPTGETSFIQHLRDELPL